MQRLRTPKAQQEVTLLANAATPARNGMSSCKSRKQMQHSFITGGGGTGGSAGASGRHAHSRSIGHACSAHQLLQLP
jgi:hypothetical protein